MLNYKLMMAKSYDPNKHGVEGWFLSEKYDGVRAVFDHKERKFYSRNGKEFIMPKGISQLMPKIDHDIDGELWEGRGLFDQTSGKARRKTSPDWTGMKFKAFDVVSNSMTYRDRLSYLNDCTKQNKFFNVARQVRIKNREQMMDLFKRYCSEGAEGLIVRCPDAMYEHRRSPNMLKVKSFHDCEVKVIGHKPGKGKYIGQTGGLICEFNGKEINVGSGLSDEQRVNPPEIGDMVTIAYFEVTKAGMPRFPTFVGVRDYE